MSKLPTKLRRIGANLAALAVGGVAATATWHHIAHVGQKYGEGMAAFLPVSIDGMMIAGVLMAADAKAAGRPVSPWARVATWAGGALSIAAQVESGRERGPVAAAIATVFSLTLIITIEAVTWQRRIAVAPATLAPVPEVPARPSVAAAISTAPLPAPVSPAPPTLRRDPVSPLTGRVLTSSRVPR